MIVYRIVLAKFSDKLFASGRVARWNSAGTFVIYTANSRALACLENLVHRTGEGLNALFRTMVIEVPDSLSMEEVSSSDLKKEWQFFENQMYTRTIGDEWVSSLKSSVLKVPSAIIPQEYNYILNPNHPDFKHIRLLKIEPFIFDGRF